MLGKTWFRNVHEPSPTGDCVFTIHMMRDHYQRTNSDTRQLSISIEVIGLNHRQKSDL